MSGLGGAVGAGARGAWRTVRQVLSDTDTYIFGGMGLIFVGVASAVTVAVAAVVAGVLLLAYGIWMLPAPPKEGD